MNPNQPQANTGVVTPVSTGGGVVLPNQSPIVSSAPAFGDFVVGNIQLNKYLNEPDPYINAYQAMLGNLQQVNAQQQKNTIASATAETSRTRQQLEQDQNRYLAGMESAGIASGASKYLPQYQEGLMAQARDSYMQKFQQVDQAEKLAIAKAYQARQEGDVMVLREQLGLIEKLRKEKADALENAQRMEWEQYKFKKQMELVERDAKTSEVDPIESIISQLSPSKRLGSGSPVLYNGTLTQEGFQKISAYATANGIGIAELAEIINPYIARNKKGKPDPGYGLSGDIELLFTAD